MLCYSPFCSRHATKEARMNHRVHHIIHFVTETILFALAFAEQEYVNSLGVCFGLTAASVCFLTRSLPNRFRVHGFMLGLLVSTLATLLGILVFGVEIASRVDEGELLSVVIWNIVSFAIVANVVRLNAMAHVYIQWCQELWVWIHVRALGVAPAVDDRGVQPHVSGYDTCTPAFRKKRRTRSSNCANVTRRAVMTLLLAGVCVLGVVFWLLPDASDAFHSRGELCTVNAYERLAKCLTGQNLTGSVFRIWANTSSIDPPIDDDFRACLSQSPGMSIPCWANPHTGRLYYSKPAFPTGLTVGLCFLVLVIALAGAMTVRSAVLWSLDRKSGTNSEDEQLLRTSLPYGSGSFTS